MNKEDICSLPGLFKYIKSKINNGIQAFKQKWKENRKFALDQGAWVAGMQAAGAALSFIFYGQPLIGLVMLIPMIFIPPVYKFLNKRFSFNIPFNFKTILITLIVTWWFGIFIIGGFYYKIPP